MSTLSQDSDECRDAIANIDEIPSCDDVGLNNRDLCKADPATTACSLPAGDSKLTATGSVLVLDGGPYNYGLDIDSCTLNGNPQTYDLLGPYQPIGNGCGD